MAPSAPSRKPGPAVEASLPLGWQLSGLYRFDELWVALAEGDTFDDYASGTGAACAAPGDAGSSSASVAASASEVASAEPSTAAAPLVGVWRGEHDCRGIARALADAGFDEAVIIEAVVGNGLIPNVTSPAEIPDAAELCADATVLEHSHEFTADGQFFSYDQDGNEVDFGTYELVDDDTVAIGDQRVAFDFTIVGDHLTLEPQVEPGCLEFECQWAVMVAMPWSGMDRVE